MRILIAGGSGYIGSSLVPKLFERGYKVDVVDLMWFGNNLPNGTKILEQDLLDLNENDIEGYDQVIFLAGLSNDPMAEYSPTKNFIYNAAAPAYLGYIAKKAGVKRYIHSGSCSVYGYTVDELYDEKSPTISQYPYGISKLQGEQAAIQLVDEHFSVIAFRQGTISGYSPRMRLDLVVNAMFKSAVQDNEILVNNPSIWRPVLDMRDVVMAYVRAVEASDGVSGIFNIASGNYTVGEIADYVKEGVKEGLGIDPKLTIKNVQDCRNYKVSFEKARNVLGFKPNHNINSIVQNLIENMDKFGDFSNPLYYNIQIFKTLELE